MGDNDVSKLQPPKLFGRGKAPKSPAPEPEVAPVPDSAPEAEAPVVQSDPAPEAAATARHAGPQEESAEEPAKAPKEPKRPKAPKAARQRTPRRPKPARRPAALRLPRLHRPAGLVPTAIVGLVVGAVLAGLTWCFVQLDAGEHLTFVYVVIVFIAAVVVGSIGLRLLRVRSAGTIAFLGTGVVAMVAMCVGSGPLETLGGAIGVIVGSAPAYALAAWVTARFIDRD